MATTFTYKNSNSVFDGGAFFNTPQNIIVGAEALVLNFTANLAPSNYDAALIGFFGTYNITVNGVVGTFADLGSLTDTGIAFAAKNGDPGVTGNSKLTIGADGFVFGGGAGVAGFHGTNVTNAGTIQSEAHGIQESNSSNWSITNTASGEITVLEGNAIYAIGGGAHTIVNQGLLYSENGHAIFGEDGGAEKVTNSGTIDGAFDLGDGNDTFTNTGRIFFDIFMGSGNDVFSGGASGETAWDEGGKDSYKFGAGDDTFIATGFEAGDANLDTVDGGAGIDWYDAFDATGNLRINLDTVVRHDPVFNIDNAALTATGLGDIGIDKVTGIENVDGGLGNDSIFGSAAANELWGNEGNDNLFGLGGNDTLDGGTGLDDLFGGAGRDFLDGGFTDGATDTFHYETLKDSTQAITGRDIIFNFEDANDWIDFSAIDAKIGGGGLMGFIGVNTPFQQVTAGDVRVVSIGSGWLIQVDAGVDGKVDMAIEVFDLAHVIDWGSEDFLF